MRTRTARLAGASFIKDPYMESIRPEINGEVKLVHQPYVDEHTPNKDDPNCIAVFVKHNGFMKRIGYIKRAMGGDTTKDMIVEAWKHNIPVKATVVDYSYESTLYGFNTDHRGRLAACFMLISIDTGEEEQLPEPEHYSTTDPF